MLQILFQNNFSSTSYILILTSGTFLLETKKAD